MIMESKQAIHYNDYVINMIKKKLKLYLLVVLILLKMFRHTKISVLKIGMLMSKTDCINLCKQKAH